MSATIGELVVSLKASTAQFSSDLKDASSKTTSAMSEIQRSVDGLGDSFKRLGELFAVDKLGEFVQHSVEYAHQIGNLSIAIGESVEQTSRLAYAAQQSDVSIDQLSKTMGVLSKTLLAAQTGNKKDATLFSFLGIDDVKNISSANDLLLKLVDAFSKLPAGIDRTEVATGLLNRTGINMLPWLTSSTEELKKLMAQSDATGATVTASQARMAEQLTNAYQKITAVAEGFTLELATKLSPALLSSAESFQAWSTRIGGAQSAADKTATVLQGMFRDLVQLNPVLAIGVQLAERLYKAFGGTISAPQLPDVNKQLQSATDFLKNTGGSDAADFAKRWAAALEALNTKSEQLKQALGEITARLDAQTAGMKSTTAATDLQRLATLGATAAQLDAIDKQERWALVVESSRNLAVQTAQDFRKLTEEQRNQTANLQTAVNLQNAIKDIKAAAANADNPLGPVIGDNALQQAAKMDELVRGLTESLSKQLELLNQAPDAYFLMVNGIQKAQAASKEHVLDITHQIQATVELRATWNAFGRDAEQALDGLLFQGKSLGDVFSDLAKRIGEMALQWSLFGASGKGGLFGDLGKVLGISAGSSNGIGSFLTSLFRAGGGPVSANSPYIVGEKGPELFVPGSGGSIVPNGSWKASGGGDTYVTNNYVDARGAQVGFAQQIAAALKATEDRAVNRSVKQVADLRLRTA